MTKAAALFLAALLAGHRFIGGFPGFVFDSGLPWLGIGIVVLLLSALLRRSLWDLAFIAAPIVVWCALFGSNAIGVFHGDDSPGDVVVASQNLLAGSGSSKKVAAQMRDADLIAVQELEPTTAPGLNAALRATHPFTYVVGPAQGTVAMASKFRLSAQRTLLLGQPFGRAIRADVHTDIGVIRVYVLHAPSVSTGDVADRNDMLAALESVLAQDRSKRMIVMGDFNAGSSDRAMRRLLSEFDDQLSGFGFTWPAQFPFVRLDHILTRGLTGSSASVSARTPSDHRGVRVSLSAR